MNRSRVIQAGLALTISIWAGSPGSAQSPAPKPTAASTPFVPADFNPPTLVRADRFQLVPLGPALAKVDFDAYMSSIEHLQKTFSRSTNWPHKDISSTDAMQDMQNEQARFKARKSFAYAVLTPDGSRELGSVYVSPSPDKSYDAIVRMWVTKAQYDAGFDAILYRWVANWIKTDWPFHAVAYPGRSIDWATWDARVAAGNGATAAIAKHPFNGRWRMDTTSLKGNIKPTIFQLADGGFRKDGEQIVRADGRLHPVTGSGYVDQTSISIESDHVVKEVDRVHGKLAYTVEYIVSPDRNTLTWHVASFTNPNGKAVTSETIQRRVGLPVKGAHLISGKWERVSVSVDAKSDWIMKLDGDRFTWRTDEGTGYEAIVGGPPVKIDGDSSGARAVITRPQPDTIIETDLSLKNERDSVLTMQLMPDQNTIRGTATSPSRNISTTFYMHRIAG